MEYTCYVTTINSLKLSDIYMSATFAVTGSDNGLVPTQLQAIIWTNADEWSIGPQETKI